MGELRIATRASALALSQAHWVADRIRRAHPGREIRIVEIETAGDLDRRSSVTALTEVGAFVRAVQQAVLEGRADLAVHSYKDLPVAGPDGLTIACPVREAPWDVLCGARLDDLPIAARVGTGSPRRAAQLRRLRPDLTVEDIRGNVDTRLRRVAEGEYDAVVLAEAGLRRIGRIDAIDQRFTLTEMVPAPGQAALAVEAREGTEAARLAALVEDPGTRRAVDAERALLALTGAGCRSALGALATIEDGGIRLTGFVEDELGARFATASGSSPIEAARALAGRLGLTA